MRLHKFYYYIQYQRQGGLNGGGEEMVESDEGRGK